MFGNGNPVMKESTFERDYQSEISSTTGYMSVNGTIQKTFLLFAILLATSVVGWAFASMPLLLGSAVVGFVLALILCFKPLAAPVLAPIYAVAEGLFVGAVSKVTYLQLADKPEYSQAIPLAAFGTIATLGIMLFLYASRIIRVSERMRAIGTGLILSVFVFYGACFLLSFIIPDQIRGISLFNAGPIGIGFSVFVIGLAAFKFLLDFDMIEQGVRSRAPKQMEWYGAFALIVTVVWLYLEILNLVRKLASSR